MSMSKAITNVSKVPLAACDQISSVKESSTPGISYQTMLNVHYNIFNSLNAFVKMLISLLLPNATKLYVRFVCFGYSLSVEHVCIVFLQTVYIVLYCMVYKYFDFGLL